MDDFYDQWHKARCKGMIRSYLHGKKTSLKMVLAFLNPPNEASLSRDIVVSLFKQVLLETRYPIPERLETLKQALRPPPVK